MKIIRFEDVADLNIPPEDFYGWVEETLAQKHSAVLPPKISLKQTKHGFFNVMPCLLPDKDVMGVKVVTRLPPHDNVSIRVDGSPPSLPAQILLYRQSSGELLALMDGTYITTMRTGAAAAQSVNMLAKSSFASIGFIGLGNTARAAMSVLASTNRDKRLRVGLLRYKDQAESFTARFCEFKNLDFNIIDSLDELIESHDVIISSITYTDEVFAGDYCFKPGCTVIPIHTRGFQNCDLFFDKVFADDCGHVKGFQHFDKFRSFAETCDVLSGKAQGRMSDDERILVYNIGIAVHDIYCAYKIYSLLNEIPDSINLLGDVKKFWA